MARTARARRDGQAGVERAQAKSVKGQRVPREGSLLLFSFVSLFSFVLPFALQRDTGTAQT